MDTTDRRLAADPWAVPDVGLLPSSTPRNIDLTDAEYSYAPPLMFIFLFIDSISARRHTDVTWFPDTELACTGCNRAVKKRSLTNPSTTYSQGSPKYAKRAVSAIPATFEETILASPVLPLDAQYADFLLHHPVFLHIRGNAHWEFVLPPILGDYEIRVMAVAEGDIFGEAQQTLAFTQDVSILLDGKNEPFIG